MKRYVPDRGDIVWIDFDPQSGHEQAGRRPALVVSPKNYNATLSLALFCPITSRVKGLPFEVPIGSKNLKTSGVVLADQVKSKDWSARDIKFIEKADRTTLAKVISIMHILIDEY
jgi:mRNA interferase MazF